MTIQKYIAQYADYNLWANRQMIQWLLTMEPIMLDKEVPSSFDTVNKTLSHIWVAEHVWMCRIEGIGWKNLNSRHDGKNTQEIGDDILLCSQYYIDKIDAVSDTDLVKNYNYTLLSGDMGSSTLSNIIHHVCNHSTYHRGQLVTMGRTLGYVDPPKTDFIHYANKYKI